MKNARAVVLYVGKAKNLRARVASYFQTRKDDRYQIRLMMRHVADVEYVVTDTEKEALLLENTLIKKHRPRYNIVFRDDRSFLNVKLTTQHPYPGIYLTRRVVQDGSTYFGPYTSALACRETIEQITRNFRLRTCTDRDFANRSRPCIQYQIGRCTAPCVGYVDAIQYVAQVKDAARLLKGEKNSLVDSLKEKMRRASQTEQFEEAARLRNLLHDIAVTVEPQKVVRHEDVDHDYVGWASEGSGEKHRLRGQRAIGRAGGATKSARILGRCAKAGFTPAGATPLFHHSREEERGAVAIIEMRDGKVVSRAGTAAHLGGDDPTELVSSFMAQYYQPPRIPPPVICLPFAVEKFAALASLLNERRGARVKLVYPRRGREAKLLKLAAANAVAYVRTQRSAEEEWEALSQQCQRALQLSALPNTIECVDISNWQGKEAVGSLVCFVNGQPAKNRYRLFNVRTLSEPNDYGMMREVLERRLSGGLPRPDLLLVDGGRGQLQIAARVVEELKIDLLPIAAIAKPAEGEITDKVYLPGRKNALALKTGSPVLLFLQRIRDEAHRFGITRQRRRQQKASLSVL